MPITRYQEENYQRHKHNSFHFTKSKNYGEKATCARIVFSYRPQKEDPYQVQITVVVEKSTMQVKYSRQMLTLPQTNSFSTVLSAPNFLNS